MIKVCAPRDTARAGESCHPGWTPPEILEEDAGPVAGHRAVNAERAAAQGFCHVGSESLAPVRGGPGEGLGIHSAGRYLYQRAEGPSGEPRAMPAAPTVLRLERRAGLMGGGVGWSSAEEHELLKAPKLYPSLRDLTLDIWGLW